MGIDSPINLQISKIQRLLRNLIRIGTVSAVNLDGGLSHVDTGKKYYRLAALAEHTHV